MSCAAYAAEEPRNPPTIGQVFGSNPSASKPYDQAFRDGLRDSATLKEETFGS